MEQPRAGSWLMWSAFYNTWLPGFHDHLLHGQRDQGRSMEEHLREVLWANPKLAHISHHLTFPGLGISHMVMPTCCLPASMIGKHSPVAFPGSREFGFG